MTGRKRIAKYDNFGLQLTQAEKKLILDGVSSLPQQIAQTMQRTPAKQPVRMTLDDWKELAGHIAFKPMKLWTKSSRKGSAPSSQGLKTCLKGTMTNGLP